MPKNSQTRRKFLKAAVSGIALVGAGSGTAMAQTSERPNVTRYTLLEGTEQSTGLYIIDSGNPGPTGLVIGGTHGNEEAGYGAANSIVNNLIIERGRVIVIPEANRRAVEEDRRFIDQDLNRQFPLGETPTTELARAMWQVTRLADPDIVIDLHESTGLFRREPEGVGQAIFYSPNESSLAKNVATNVNENSVPVGSNCRFLIGEIDMMPQGTFTAKTAFDLGVPSFLVETYRGLPLATRINYMLEIVVRLLMRTGFQ